MTAAPAGTAAGPGPAAADASPVPPARRRRGLRRRLLPLASVAGTIALLEAAVRAEVVDPLYVPYPSTILVRLVEDLLTQQLWAAIAATLGQAVAGLAAGGAAAVVAGLLLGTFPALERALNPVIEFLRPIPSIAILPLVILWLGLGHESVVLLVANSAFWLVLVLTVQGARSVDPLTRDAMTVFGLGARQRFVRLTLPSALPFVITGTRIAGAVAIVVAITAELLGGMDGLGRLVMRAELGADRVGMFAYIVVAGLLGLVVNAALERAERRLLVWHPSQRKEA